MINSRFFLALALIFGTLVLIPAHSESDQYPEKIVFRNLFTPLQLEIDIDSSGTLAWLSGFDSGGSGHVCPSDSEFYCLVVEGQFTFAIPNKLITNPKIAAKWDFGNFRYELIEVVQINAKLESELTSVINATGADIDVTFHFSAPDGVQFFSHDVDLSDDDEPDLVRSVWVNVAILRDRTE